MEVKRKSLLSRISNWGEYRSFDNDYDNLCKYSQRIFLKVVLGLALMAVVSMITYLIAVDPFTWPILIVMASVALCCILPATAIYYTREHFGTPEMPYENILFAYLRAKKDKLCPIIEYVD